MTDDNAVEPISVDESDAYRVADKLILPERIVGPATGELLYHYCSPATALAILQNRTLRFSDITLLNDAEEGVWGRERVFGRALECLRSGRGVPAEFPQVEEEFLNRLERGFKAARRVSKHYAACFSLEADSLSQWRAYARDAEGFALGFELAEWPSKGVYPVKVQYDPDAQLHEIFGALAAIHDRFGDDIDTGNVETRHCVIALSNRAIAFKNPAFRDEREVRLVGNVVTGVKPNLNNLHIAGWIAGEEGWHDIKISFEERSGLITPFFDLPYDLGPNKLRLRAISAGPRCKSSTADINHLLATLGYTDVEVLRAGAAYR